MPSPITFFAPLALLLPALAGQGGVSDEKVQITPEAKQAAMSFQRSAPAPFQTLQQGHLPQVQHQVRIEGRVIIRIAPSPPSARQAMLSELPRRQIATRYQEERMRGCVPIEGIAGVQPLQQENRLLLFMRDRRVLSAALERSCRAQAFYSGFYIERGDDGMLCASRDLIQSRAGAKCEVAQLNRLVAVRD